MAEKYDFERTQLNRRAKIQKAREALKAASEVLDWAKDNAHNKDHWHKIEKEEKRFAEVSNDFFRAAASPDAPIQAAVAEGYRDYVIREYDHRDDVPEVVVVTNPDPPEPKRTFTKVASVALKLVQGGGHAKSIYAISTSSKQVADRSGVPAVIGAVVAHLTRMQVSEIKQWASSLLGANHPAVRDL